MKTNRPENVVMIDWRTNHVLGYEVQPAWTVTDEQMEAFNDYIFGDGPEVPEPECPVLKQWWKDMAIKYNCETIACCESILAVAERG